MTPQDERASPDKEGTSPDDERTVRADALLSRLRQACLGEYEILSEAGRGGMAFVYLAHDLSLDRKVAVKVIAPNILWMGEGIAERFKREARVSASLSHPHIIPIYAVKEREDLLFFVMKFVKGRTLESVIAEVGPLPVSMVHTILTQVGGALGYAHRQGVVHRDIKPANIMLDEEGWAVVTDFGIAKVATAQGLTQTGSAVGTPAYMSPEQCSALTVTGASDQYALGVVAYEMLTGRKPFEASTAMSLMYKHVHTAPEPLHRLLPDCPPDISDAVMRMLAKAPGDRWPQLEDMVAGLGAVPPHESDQVRTQMLALAKSSSARAIVERFQTPTSPAPASRPARPAPAGEQTREGAPSAEVARGEAAHTSATEGPTAAEGPGGESPPRERRWPWPMLLGGAGLGAGTAVLLLWAPWQTPAPPGVGPTDGVPDELPAAPVEEGSVAELEVTAPTGALEVGETATLQVTVHDDDGSPVEGEEIVWASLDAGVATVSSSGVVTARGAGSVEITAAAGGRMASARITVVEPAAAPGPAPAQAAVASLELTPRSGSLAVGGTLRVDAVLRDAGGGRLTGRPITWRSSDESVARVSAAGVVSGIGAGTARITGSVEGREQAVTIAVESAEVTSIAVTPPTGSVEVGESIRLAAAARDARGNPVPDRTIGWSSSDEGVAVVSAGGEVTGVSPGQVRITASVDETGGSAEVVVTAPTEEVEIDHGAQVQAVVQAYARALQEQDLAEARRHYPDMSADEQRAWADFFANVRDLRVAMSVRELSMETRAASASIALTLTYRDTRRQQQRSESQLQMIFRQEGGEWQIREIR